MLWFKDWPLPVIRVVIPRLHTRMPMMPYTLSEINGAFDVLQRAPVVTTVRRIAEESHFNVDANEAYG